MSTSKVKAALTRKLGPLPAWLWLVIVGGGIYYWRHRNAAASAAVATGTAAGVPAGAGSGIGGSTGSGDSGGGGGGDLPQPPIAGAGGTASWDPLQQPGGTDTITVPGMDTAPAPGDVPTTAPTAAPSPLRRGSSQPLTAAPGTVQPLFWGGQTFVSKSAFDRWASQHGTNTNAILALHPEAARIYGQLTGPAAAHAPAKRSVKTVVAGLVKPRAQQPAAKATVPAGARPESIRPKKKAVTLKVNPVAIASRRLQPQTKTQVAKAGKAVDAVKPPGGKTPVAAPKPPPPPPVAPAPPKAKPPVHAPTTKAPVTVVSKTTRTKAV